jgi:hypothetical protein
MISGTSQEKSMIDVRVGSFATFTFFWDVRFASDSDRRADIPKASLSASKRY